jgi:hypothetical protein
MSKALSNTAQEMWAEHIPYNKLKQLRGIKAICYVIHTVTTTLRTVTSEQMNVKAPVYKTTSHRVSLNSIISTSYLRSGNFVYVRPKNIYLYVEICAVRHEETVSTLIGEIAAHRQLRETLLLCS